MDMQQNNNYRPEVNVYPHRVTLLLGLLVLAIATGHVIVHAMSVLFDITSTPLAGLFRFFNMGGEANLPAYVSALNLLFASSLSLLIARMETNTKKRLTWYWWGLAVGLLIMSFDEAAQIHEGIVGEFLKGSFGRGEGVFYYLWYRAYIPLICILGCLYMPFLRRLPSRYSLRMVASGLLFLGGSIGFELLESYLSFYDRPVGISILFEETLEMLGVVVLIHTLLLYLAESDYNLRFNLILSKDEFQK